MAANRGPLVSLLLQKESPNHHEYLHAASSIAQDVSQIGFLLDDEPTRDSVFLHLDRVLPRLQSLFEVLSSKGTSQKVAEEISENLLLPLIQENDQIISLDQACHLVGFGLPVIVSYPSPHLKQVAEALIVTEGLLDRLVSHKEYSEVLKAWFQSKNSFLEVKLLQKLTDTLVKLCDACSADHGTVGVSKRWHEAQALKESLELLIGDIQEEEQKKSQKSRDLPLLAGLRRLDVDDKKANIARHKTLTRLEVPQDITDRLARFSIAKPESLRALQITLQKLEGDETMSIMCSALRTFPCRFCLERLTGAVSLALVATEKHDPFTDVKLDIFGKRVGLWKVLLSNRVLKDAKKLARSGSFNRVEQKLRDLASGEWKGKDLSMRAGSKQQKEDMRIPILQARVTQKLFLLWQIDVGLYEDLPGVPQQLVKVWQVATAEEIPNSISQILLIQQSYSTDVVRMCCKRPSQQADGRFIPLQFPDMKSSKPSVPHLEADNHKAIEKSLIEMSNKFYSLTEPFLRSITEPTGREEFPFDLSQEEMEIVSHFRSSSLILGRSGTGKTTCLVFKILAKYRARQSIPDERPIRQLLLTRSTYLASKLQVYTRSLIESQVQKAIFKNVDNTDDFIRGDDYTNRNMDSIFSLNDENFPIVCTFDIFLNLIENTVKRADRQNFLVTNEASDKNYQTDITGSIRTWNGQRVIDFNIFKTEYLEHLSGALTSAFPAELVFSEIMGVIKGSISSVETLAPLSRQQYLETSCRLAPTFSTESERDRVYSAFERYEKIKKQRGEIDDMDRVIALLRSIKETPTLGQSIRRCFEEIYVDEVQDLRCVDIVLLLNCVGDARGIHLAGDTAQCISKDSVFRFPEIKALFHGQYASIANELGQPDLARPIQFSLSRNYRSHQGILSLASYVMQMLWTGFPDTIDKLDPEIGQLGGPAPIVFAGFDYEILSAKMIGLVKLHDRIADFGAEQVILVRDDASKTKLQKKIGEMALVLTILESKGMEFDDVLVYDFFSGSSLRSGYRCLRLLARGNRNLFDSQKHAALSSELKHLYVAVTRARHQLWFVESIESSVEPLLESLTENGRVRLIDIVRPKDPDVAEKAKVLRAGGSVDPERWFKRGAQLLHQKNFADALLCFKKAHDEKGITQCQAYLSEQEARACRSRGDMEGFASNYERAATLFLDVGLIAESSKCFEGLCQYQKAAQLWRDQKQYERAAALFEKANLFNDASECYHLNGSYEDAVEVLRRGDSFDEMIQYLSRNSGKVSESALRRHSRLCNILLKQGRVSAELRAKTVNMLGSDTEKESFFREFDMVDQLVDLYRSKRRYQEIYYIYLEHGQLNMALDIVMTHNLFAVIPTHEIETVFHYIQVGDIFSQRIIQRVAGTQQISDLRTTFSSTPLADVAWQWETAHRVFTSIDNPEEVIEISAIDDGITKDFICLFIISFESSILYRSRMAYLPFDVLVWATQVVQRVSAGDISALDSLSLVCGVFDMVRTHKTVTLPWSVLKLGPSDYYTLEEFQVQAARWIRGRLSDVVEAFDDETEHYLKREFPKKCLQFLLKGHCQKQRAGECYYWHDRGDEEHDSTKIMNILRVCSVYASMVPLYLQRVMDQEFQSKYLGRRRRWMERLIEELTFVSPFDQAPSAIITAKSHLHSDQQFVAAGSTLEDLLFHRLGKEWESRNRLSMMLEQIQLARDLGPQVSTRFFRALSKKIGYHLHRYGRRAYDLGVEFNAVKAAEQIYTAVASRNCQKICTGVQLFLRFIERSEMDAFSAFQAVVSVFEFTTTFLLCMVNAGHAVAIPWSWAVFHLQAIVWEPNPVIKAETEEQRHLYGQCLLELISGFCDLIEKLERSVSYGEIWFSYGGRRNVPAIAIRKRNTDLLTVVALNLGYSSIPLRGFSEVWSRIQKLLTPSGSSQQTNLRKLLEDFGRSFQSTNGKDAFHIITLDDSGTCPAYLRGFTAHGAKLMKLNAVLETTRQSQETNTSSKAVDQGLATDDYTQVEWAMVTKLQRRWRRILPRIREARKLRQDPEGMMRESVMKLCANCLPSDCPSSTKIAVRALLLTDGVHLMMGLEGVLEGIQKLRAVWKSLFADTTSTANLELLDSLLGDIGKCESTMTNKQREWSIKGLENSPLLLRPKKLRKSATNANYAIRQAVRELKVISQKLKDMGGH